MERAGKLLRKLKVPGECLSMEELIRAAWPQAVGHYVAAHTRVAGLRGARLVVEAENSTWRQQLETLRGQILRKLHEVAGKDTVATLHFEIGIPRRPVQRAGPPAEAQDEAERIGDPVLRRVYKASRRRSSA